MRLLSFSFFARKPSAEVLAAVSAVISPEKFPLLNRFVSKHVEEFRSKNNLAAAFVLRQKLDMVTYRRLRNAYIGRGLGAFPE